MNRQSGKILKCITAAALLVLFNAIAQGEPQGGQQHATTIFSITDTSASQSNHFAVLDRDDMGKITGKVYPGDGVEEIGEITGEVSRNIQLNLRFKYNKKPAFERIFEIFNGLYIDKTQLNLHQPFSQISRSTNCLIIVNEARNEASGCKNDTLEDFLGVTFNDEIGGQYEERLVIAENKFDAFLKFVSDFHGTVVKVAELKGRRHVRISIPALSKRLFKDSLDRSDFELITSRDCFHFAGEDDTFHCFESSVKGGYFKPSTYEIYEYNNQFMNYRIRTISGVSYFATDVLFLHQPEMTQHASVMTTPLIKAIFGKGTFFKRDAPNTLAEPSERALVKGHLAEKLCFFAKKLGSTVSISPSDSSITSFNVTVIGNSKSMNVFASSYWWRVTFEVTFKIESSQYDAFKYYDVALVRIQDLQVTKSPVDKKPEDASFKHLTTILDQGGDLEGDLNTIPSLAAEIASRFAATYGGITLHDINSD